MPDYVSKCELCTHLLRIGSNKSLNGWVCRAFPEGIPTIILSGVLRHETIIDIYPGQVMPFLYKDSSEEMKRG